MSQLQIDLWERTDRKPYYVVATDYAGTKWAVTSYEDVNDALKEVERLSEPNGMRATFEVIFDFLGPLERDIRE
jgi:hypothetical protein